MTISRVHRGRRLGSGIDLSNQSFGRLNVVKRVLTDKRHTRWLCICECGGKAIVRTECLLQGTTRSCGCFARDLARRRNQKKPDVVNLHSIYLGYIAGARDRNIEFHLSEKMVEVLVKSNCTYCGIEPSQVRMVHKNQSGEGRGKPYLYNGIDRRDSACGYTYDNCVPCCSTCNRAKRDSTEKQFLSWLDRIAKYRSSDFVEE